MSSLADRLKRALARKPGTSQAGLAAYCGVKAPSVSQWFSGETKTLKSSSLRKAAEYLGCSRDWLETGLGLPEWEGTIASSPTAEEPRPDYDSDWPFKSFNASDIRALPADQLQMIESYIRAFVDMSKLNNRAA
ncbi:helix-turn-helix domain-containing protein [Piscinibacter sp. Jin2]|uniref:Helix-turn-helix domain-containing protein n=1 Tax=Aquariibacter lacus TaxID=2801332 RepID=A0A9X1BNM6_9BURK|nr:helix-turn-helix domain-containing protein [Piscinibacter lacus]MBL0720210.1 helix-turn-helix domain-containing protein [Piscinibacter lacus]